MKKKNLSVSLRVSTWILHPCETSDQQIKCKCCSHHDRCKASRLAPSVTAYENEAEINAGIRGKESVKYPWSV